MTATAPRSPGTLIVNAGFGLLGLATTAMAVAACATLAGGPHLLPLALADDAAADQTADPGEARRWTQTALATRPVDVASWVRLAGQEASPLQNQLGPAALQALDRSYAVGPYASQVLESRVVFVYDHWTALSPDLQSQVVSEVKAAWPVAPQQHRLLATAGRVHESAGALALSGLLLTLKLQDDAGAAARRTATAGHNP